LVSWLAEHRQGVLIALAVTAVVFPLLIGMALGHIPKHLFFGGAIPLAAATFILAIGVQLLDRHLEPVTKLVVSLLFGLIWFGAGLQICSIEKRSEDPDHPAAKPRRLIGYLFIIFGLIWSLLSIFRYRQ
jgi:hypothetical protein